MRRYRRPSFSFFVALVGLIVLNTLLAAVASPGALYVTDGAIVLYLGRISPVMALIFVLVTMVEVLFMVEF